MFTRQNCFGATSPHEPSDDADAHMTTHPPDSSADHAADEPVLGPVPHTRFRVDWVTSTGSTNDDLLVRARDGAGEGEVLVTDFQTAGRGRLDRRWEAPERSSLLMSILLRPGAAVPPDHVHLCTKAVALAAAEACDQALGGHSGIGLKWPNDLIVTRSDGSVRKLGGVLAESMVDGGQIVGVVVGLGLNVTWPRAMPADLAEVAIALNHLLGHGTDGADNEPKPVISRGRLLLALLTTLEGLYSSLLDDGGQHLLRRYRSECVTIGRSVRVEHAVGDLLGVAIGIDDAGHLIVRDPAGEEHHVAVGDVVHVRNVAT